MRLSLYVLAAICLLAASATTVFAVPQQKQMLHSGDNFEGYVIPAGPVLYVDLDGDGDIDDNDWQTWGAPANVGTDRITEIASIDGSQVAHLKDTPGLNNTNNSQIYSNYFTPVPVPADVSLLPGKCKTGLHQVTMDIKPMNGTFKLNMTNGTGFTSGFNWCVGLGFGSSSGNAYLPGMTVGTKLGLQRTTTAWDDTAVPYTVDTWYTAKFLVNVDARTYQVWFGERGGALSQVNTGWSPWITGSATPPTSFGGMLIATSNTKTTVSNQGGGELYLDNVAYVPEPASILTVLALVGLVPALRRRK